MMHCVDCLDRGHRAVSAQPAVRNPRYSVMAGINVNGTVAYSILPGSMNTFKLFWWTYVIMSRSIEM